ncbi:MAG: M20/M25/M40 family metallo-hydrolase [Candidatus Eisenbacteria bacterium]
MITRLRAALAAMLVSALAATPSSAAEPFTHDQLDAARAVRERALADDTGYDLLRSLTTEVGPRLCGTPGDARAVAWALARLKALGFANVHAEPVKVPHWVRGTPRVEIVAPFAQPMVAVTLGGSIATPDSGIAADVVGVSSMAELALLPDSLVRGRIVYFGGRMTRSTTGSGYGAAVPVRGRGAGEAGKRGAVAVIIRSIGTDHDRVGHTGGMRFEKDEKKIPAFALSIPDADLLERQLASGRTVRVRLRDDSYFADSAMSANVVGEIPGRNPRAGVVVLGAHLDSWDLGQGAHDDGTGVAIMTAAARLIGQSGVRPLRTIRVVLFANEEFGLSGAREYARAHAAEAATITAGMESDLGAFRPLSFSSRVDPALLPVVRAMGTVLAPLGVPHVGNEATGDADVGRLYDLGVPVFDLDTDASTYFDLHHTPNDTFDKVDPAMVRLNTACYASLAYLLADYAPGFGRAPRPAPAFAPAR